MSAIYYLRNIFLKKFFIDSLKRRDRIDSIVQDIFGDAFSKPAILPEKNNKKKNVSINSPKHKLLLPKSR